MTLPPIRAVWEGDVLRPLRPSLAILHDELGQGEIVVLDVERGRSETAHRHQFAWLRTAWGNLPETMQGEAWARSPDTLRKYALVRTGWANPTQVDCGTAPAAARVQAVLLVTAQAAHGYAEATIRGPILTLLTPRSQSVRAMGGSDFARSKADVLGFVADLLGVERKALEDAA